MDRYLLWPMGSFPGGAAGQCGVGTSCPAVSGTVPADWQSSGAWQVDATDWPLGTRLWICLALGNRHDASETHDYATAAATFAVFGEHSAMQPTATSVVRRCRTKSQINETIKRLLHTTPGLTTKQIADRIGASYSHTAHALRRLRLHLGEARIEGRPHRYYPVMIATDLRDVGYGDQIEERRAARRRRAARVTRQRRG